MHAQRTKLTGCERTARKRRRRAVRLSEWLGVSVLTLRQMLDARWHNHPSVFTHLVDGDGRRWKLWLRECSDRHVNEFLATFQTPIDGGTAPWTEPKRGSVTFVSDANILVRFTGNFDRLGSETRLSAKDAAGALLAGKTMADGYPERLFGYGDRELTAATGCDTFWHSATPLLTPNEQGSAERAGGRHRTAAGHASAQAALPCVGCRTCSIGACR